MESCNIRALQIMFFKLINLSNHSDVSQWLERSFHPTEFGFKYANFGQGCDIRSGTNWSVLILTGHSWHRNHLMG